MILCLVSSVALGSKVRYDLEAVVFKAFDHLFYCVLGDDVFRPHPNTVAVHIDAEAASRFVTEADYYGTHPLGCLKQPLLETSLFSSRSKEPLQHASIITQNLPHWAQGRGIKGGKASHADSDRANGNRDTVSAIHSLTVNRNQKWTHLGQKSKDTLEPCSPKSHPPCPSRCGGVTFLRGIDLRGRGINGGK